MADMVARALAKRAITPQIDMTETTVTIVPNTFYVWGEVAALTLTLGEDVSDVLSEYMFQFESGSEATTFNNIAGVTWYLGTPTILSNRTYQVSIVNGIGMCVGVEVSS